MQTPISKHAILAIFHAAFAGERMEHDVEKEIIRQWQEAGHAKDFDNEAFLMQLKELKRQQDEEDNFLFPEGRVVYVVNTETVDYLARGTVMCKSRERDMGMIWVQLEDDPLWPRAIQVCRCNLLVAKQKTALAGEEVIDGDFRYTLASL